MPLFAPVTIARRPRSPGMSPAVHPPMGHLHVISRIHKLDACSNRRQGIAVWRVSQPRARPPAAEGASVFSGWEVLLDGGGDLVRLRLGLGREPRRDRAV